MKQWMIHGGKGRSNHRRKSRLNQTGRAVPILGSLIARPRNVRDTRKDRVNFLLRSITNWHQWRAWRASDITERIKGIFQARNAVAGHNDGRRFSQTFLHAPRVGMV